MAPRNVDSSASTLTRRYSGCIICFVATWHDELVEAGHLEPWPNHQPRSLDTSERSEARAGRRAGTSRLAICLCISLAINAGRAEETSPDSTLSRGGEPAAMDGGECLTTEHRAYVRDGNNETRTYHTQPWQTADSLRCDSIADSHWQPLPRGLHPQCPSVNRQNFHQATLTRALPDHTFTRPRAKEEAVARRVVEILTRLAQICSPRRWHTFMVHGAPTRRHGSGLPADPEMWRH